MKSCHYNQTIWIQENNEGERQMIPPKIIRPPRLRPGDKIAIVSPSSGCAGLFPHRTQRGLSEIRHLGFTPVLAPHALNCVSYVSDSPENRAIDINMMFRDPEIKAIIAAIGGNHSCHLLNLLDYETIAKNPKVFMGYSDITVLNNAIHKMTGLVTFNGPALITDFAEMPHMYPYTQKYCFKALGNPKPIGHIEASPIWTEEFLDWNEKKDMERPRKLESSPGWTWLKKGIGEGHLLGGCIESLEHLRGTKYWPDFNGAIFFFETSEEKPTPAEIDAILMDYENMGILAQINGMIVGRPMLYDAAEKRLLREIILARTAKFRFPIITDMDFGHTAPQFTLPLGVRARINAEKRIFEILESAVSEDKKFS
jgi:muramoyltetrapeptide carboxypeptidase